MNRNLKALKFVYDFSIHRFLIFKTKKNVLISLFHSSFHRKPSYKASLFSVYFVINYLGVTTIQPFTALMRYFTTSQEKRVIKSLQVVLLVRIQSLICLLVKLTSLLSYGE